MREPGREPKRGPVISRQYGVASSALPAPEPLASRQSAARMVALLPHARLVVREERTVTGTKGTGSHWGPWKDVPDGGPEPVANPRYAVQGGHNAVDLTDARRAQGQTYPIDRPRGVRRLPGQLLNDVADAIERNGYPPLQTSDLRRLSPVLFKFLYRRDI